MLGDTFTSRSKIFLTIPICPEEHAAQNQNIERLTVKGQSDLPQTEEDSKPDQCHLSRLKVQVNVKVY